MKPKDLLFLVWYSIKDILMDIFRFLEALKKPKTWSFILYSTLFLMAYYRKLTWANATIIISLIFLIYIIRQNKDTDFLKALKEKAFLNNNDGKIRPHYETYTKKCYFSVPRKEPLSYEEYKIEELKRIANDRKDNLD